MNKALLSSQKMEWETPQKLFDKLNAEFHFTLDPCCTKETAKCEKFYTKEDDGLSKSWENEIVFCNPPYGKEISQWVEKCSNEAKNGATVVMLIPARTDTRYFHKFIYGKAEIRFIKGRLKFSLNGEVFYPAPFPSMIVIFKNNKEENEQSTDSRTTDTGSC